VAKSRRFGVGHASKFAKVFCFFFAKKEDLPFFLFPNPGASLCPQAMAERTEQ
jgi:hypothetical protein